LSARLQFGQQPGVEGLLVGRVLVGIVPRTHTAQNFRAVSDSGGKEPIGERIIEVPVNIEQFELRDSRAQFLAYVPPLPSTAAASAT
jgi:hypothetical protein